MALSNAYTEAYGKLDDFFSKIRDGQAPPLFTNQFLLDLGFKSNKQRAYIPLLKALGFLTPDGKPTQRYKDYRDASKSKHIMADAIREAYGDIFLIKENPTSSDHSSVEGKFKSYHNASDNVAMNMRRTFYALLQLADMKAHSQKASVPSEEVGKSIISEPKENISLQALPVSMPMQPGLHYNIQIHLPATKDIEVYNSIFKSLKEHLF